MSADNCICILKTTDKFKVERKYLKAGRVVNETYVNTFGEGIVAYRVEEIQAHDNFFWLEENEIHNLGAWMQSTFKVNQNLFYSEKEARIFADMRLANADYVEYGIVEIDASKYNFPGC